MGLHFLAEQLGMTVAELCERMSLPEFADWERYFAQQAEARAKAQADAEAAGQPQPLELASLSAGALKAMF